MRDNRSYIAGFFDGEGCISITKNGSITLGVVNTGLPVLQEFVKYFGGSITNRKQKINKQQFVWRVYGITAVEFLDIMVRNNLLVEKKEQAELTLQWYEERKNLGGDRVSGKKGLHSNPLRQVRLDYFREQLSSMKKESFDAI